MIGSLRNRKRPRGQAAGLALLCVSVAAVSIGGGCGSTSFLITPVSPDRALVERELERGSLWAADKIALIEVSGVISNARESNLLGVPEENPVATFKERLDKAADDRLVKAVVLRINSPGGGVTASDLMYTELLRFRERTGKPVIASMLDVAASGGYYLACAADRIYAHPTTVTGSIGVIMIAPDFSGTMSKLGIQANIIKSGALKDAGSPFREMRSEDRAVFEKMILAMYERFLEVVGHSRTKIAPDKLRSLADGRVYLGPEARELGLVDEIGTLPDAILAAREAAKLGDKPVVLVQYSRPVSYRANYYAQSPAGPGPVNLVNIELPDLLRSGGPQFMYLWAPGW